MHSNMTKLFLPYLLLNCELYIIFFYFLILVNYAWDLSRKCRNKLAHLYNGNTSPETSGYIPFNKNKHGHFGNCILSKKKYK